MEKTYKINTVYDMIKHTNKDDIDRFLADLKTDI